MNINFQNRYKLPDRQSNIIYIIELIDHLQEESVDNVLLEITKFNKDILYIYWLIFYSIRIRLHNSKSILFLLEKLSEKYPSDRDLLFNQPVAFQFLHESLIVSVSLDEIFKDGSIERIIFDDNVKGFVNFISNPSFDANKKIKLPEFFTVDFQLTGSLDIDSEVSYMQLIALYGAVNCLKAALVNKSFSLENVSKYAIAGGNNEIIHLLEHEGCKFDYCLNLAAKYHNNNIFSWLQNNYECEEVQIQTAQQFFNDEIFYFLLNSKSYKKNEIKEFALYASKRGQMSCISYIIDKYKINLNEMEDKRGVNVLDNVILLGNLDMVKELVEKYGADVNHKDKMCSNSIHKASSSGKLDLMKYLLEKSNIDVNQQDYSGRTPLSIALEKNKPQIVHFLIDECRSNVNKRDNEGRTALHFAASYCDEEIISYLIERCGLQIDEYDYCNRTPLYYGSMNGNFNAIKFLFENCNADINDTKNMSKKTVLHVAASNGHLQLVKYFVEECKISCRVTDISGYTPLHYAAWNGHVSTVSYFINVCEMSANYTNYVTKTTPLSLAASKGQTAVISFLLSKGALITEDVLSNVCTKGNQSKKTEIFNYLNERHKSNQ